MMAFLALHLAAVQALPRDAWASVISEGSLSHITTVVDFITDPAGMANGQFILRRTSQYLDEKPVVMWASSETCGAVREAVTRLRSVPPPELLLPGEPEGFAVDGTEYTVRFSARYGSEAGHLVEYKSNQGTPLSRWATDTINLLKPCWSKTRPAQLRSDATNLIAPDTPR